ncbi:S8 family serine peptidase [Candidatus Nitrosotenuis sp. DW1]|uniref:S8 family serine peptidase n=1 Tax=Candidatus Nitrosotenuis sp. DW1 TaxID=2259672 RepID=UPI0015C80D86|nr:S8 family serine peptidase [Candidatus Nitrosotenuis sp. DW1]QLH09400.1 hypothetical protein DSQ19_07860 [Candidatus Nitrosotenuis sp. DW1]
MSIGQKTLRLVIIITLISVFGFNVQSEIYAASGNSNSNSQGNSNNSNSQSQDSNSNSQNNSQDNSNSQNNSQDNSNSQSQDSNSNSQNNSQDNSNSQSQDSNSNSQNNSQDNSDVPDNKDNAQDNKDKDNANDNSKNDKKNSKNEKFSDVSKPKKPEKKNIDSKILELTKNQHPEKQAAKNALDYHDGKVRLIAEFDNLNDELLNKIKNVAEVEISKGNKAQIIISMDKIQDISSFTELQKIKSPFTAIPNRDIMINGRILEDSVFIQNALQNNVSGSPVSVAIIDLGFDDKNPKISGNVVESVSFRKIFEHSDGVKGLGDEYVHGTAMAEIITNLATNTKLRLLTAGNEIEFLDAIDYAISKKVNIIVVSFTWVNYITDGKSIVTQKVEDAIKSGITVIVPSGNYAEKHWQGTFIDSDQNSWNEFVADDEGMTIYVDDLRLLEKKPILAYLKWKNLGGVSDFDLTLTNSTGHILDYSSNVQSTADDESLEYLSYIPTEIGSYSIGISHFGQIYQDAKLEIFSIYDKLEYVNPEQSVGTPTDARGAIVVGALGNSTSMPYSSIGPTDNGLNVPQILSPDGFVVSSLGQKPFYGTSSSAAYVTGLLVMLLSTHPELQSQIGANSFTELQFDSSGLVIEGFAGKLENMGNTQDATYRNSNVPESNVIQDNIREVEAIKEQVVQQMLSPDDNVNQVLNELQNLSFISEQNESFDAPPWFSNVVSWWLDNKISDAEFVTSVNYLQDEGILD